jgi:1,2-diacylglycerol 3-beta-glucosyltransferase
MKNKIDIWPKITIWVAARNEEENIINCLERLAILDYPNSEIQILIGNDQSTDNTKILVENFIANKPQFEIINIQKTINNQRGKANVLANLYEYSNGEFFLITDADVLVNEKWAKGMIKNFIINPKLGHQVGVTSINTKSIFGFLQAIDWLWALTLLKLASILKIPLTGLGNNSAVARKAYEATGGYAKIPFSITEDFALFHETIKKKFEFHNAINLNIFAKTTAMDNLIEFLHQRKRWMVGALQCPWWVVLFLYLQALFPFILLIFSYFISSDLALSILIFKIVAQILIISPTLVILKEYRLIPFLLPYEIYAWLWGFTMVVFYFLPIDIDWKGRIYENSKTS